MIEKKIIMILGKVPPPFMGPSIATEILLKSKLNEKFQLIHIDTKVNSDLTKIGKWSLSKIKKYISIWNTMILNIKFNKPNLVLIPISQSTIGFLKDSIFILIAKFFKCKILLHLRGSDFRRWLDESNKINQWYVRKCLNATSGVIVLGQNLRPIFKDIYAETQIFVAPNGGDYTIPKRTRESDILRFLYIGNLQSSKGIEDLISASIQLQKSHLGKFELQVIGGWRKEETKQKCLRMIQENNLDVKFTPPELSGNKLQELSNADIFVFPPREPEGHPWVIIEAMAGGLPIISTDQGAIIESVINGENGYIVSSSNPISIAEKLVILIENKELRKQMGAESRIRYEALFTEQVMVDNLTQIFNTVILN